MIICLSGMVLFLFKFTPSDFGDCICIFLLRIYWPFKSLIDFKNEQFLQQLMSHLEMLVPEKSCSCFFVFGSFVNKKNINVTSQLLCLILFHLSCVLETTMASAPFTGHAGKGEAVLSTCSSWGGLESTWWTGVMTHLYIWLQAMDTGTLWLRFAF